VESSPGKPKGNAMILDRLQNAEIYKGLGNEIAMALDYLRKTDFSKLSEGRHNVDGDRVYAMVQRYQTKPTVEAKCEAHRRYIDVQYVVEGCERIGYTALSEKTPVANEYDSAKDFALYNTAGELLAVAARSFAIFYPQDLHAPGLAVGKPETLAPVCKVVMKCRMPGA
jgi:biofilm protein TabA